MDKDYLRVNSEKRLADSEVNEYSVKSKAKKNKSFEKNSAIKLIFDEIYSKSKSFDISKGNIKKPMLLDSIIFSLILLVLGVVLCVVAYVLREFFLLQLLVFYFSFFVPVSLLYFFYRLDVNGGIKFSMLVYCILAGVATYIISELFFANFVSETMHSYHSNVAFRCLFELLSIALICFFVIRGMQSVSGTTSLLIACAVASGFSFTKCLSENFTALLINVSVSPGGEAVGAILNIEEFIKTSSRKIISSVATISVYRPFVFIALSVIIAKILNNDGWSLGKKTITTFFTFLFCCVTYILSSLKTSFNTLAILYNLISILFTGFLFFSAINDCIKSEKYE